MNSRTARTAALLPFVFYATAIAATGYKVELETATSGFDGETCWVHARSGAIPTSPPTVVMTTQKLLLTGSDVFYALHQTRTQDYAKTWTALEEMPPFKRRTMPDGTEIAVCDFTPKWHEKTGVLLGTGHIARYKDNRIVHHHHRKTSYAVYDAKQKTWKPWKVLDEPDLPEFANSGAGCTQRFDLEDGTILLPTYHRPIEGGPTAATVLRLGFDGETLTYLEHGDDLRLDTKRGFAEPSLTRMGDRFFLTIRHDLAGYVASGTDGLHFSDPKEWTFDDGEELGSYNTQAHWVVHPREDALFLVYTRRGADNDHVFRHRAPLFMARVDPDRLVVLRDTERVLVPERGARLGNFDVTEVSDQQTWVTVAEWMQPKGVEARGSDNTVWIAKILWED